MVVGFQPFFEGQAVNKEFVPWPKNYAFFIVVFAT